MKNTSQKKKHKVLPWVIGAIVVIGGMIGVKIYITLKNYDSICLALQKGTFPRMEANS